MEYQNNYNGDDNNNNQGYYREGGGESDNRGSYSDSNNNGYNNGYNNNYYNGYNNNYNNYENDSGYSVAALVLGILSIILCCCYGIVGITLGILGLVFALKYKKSNNGKMNAPATIGLICSIIGLILSTIMLIYTIYVLVNYKEITQLYDWLRQGGFNMGIASFFFGVILFSIFTIRLCYVYKKQYGSHCKESRTGLICGILSLIVWTIGITLGVLWYLNYSK